MAWYNHGLDKTKNRVAANILGWPANHQGWLYIFRWCRVKQSGGYSFKLFSTLELIKPSYIEWVNAYIISRLLDVCDKSPKFGVISCRLHTPIKWELRDSSCSGCNLCCYWSPQQQLQHQYLLAKPNVAISPFLILLALESLAASGPVSTWPATSPPQAQNST